MKVRSSVKLLCKDCYFVRRGKYLYMRYVVPHFKNPRFLDAQQIQDTKEDRASQPS